MVDFDKYREQSLLDMDRTGGPAAGGLTVRDYFAAKAMQAMINKIPLELHIDDTGMAKNAYQFADAMMRERDKKSQPACSVEEAFGL